MIYAFLKKLTRKILEEIDILIINVYKILSIFSLKKIINQSIKKDGLVLIEGMWDNPHHWIRSIIIRNAIADKYGSNIIGVYNEDTTVSTYTILRFLTKNKLFKPKKNILKKNYYIIKSKKHLSSVSSLKEFIRTKIDYDYPVFYFYDGFLKKFNLGTCKLSDTRLILELADCLELLDFYNDFLNKNKINAAILSHTITMRYSCLSWLLLTKKIPIYFTHYVNDHIVIKKLLKPEEMLNPKDDLPTINELKKLNEKNKKILIQRGEKYLEDNRKGINNQMSLFKTYQIKNQKYSNKKEFFIKNNYDLKKPLVVIMAHCFSDFPNYYGRCWYADYFEWIDFTLKTVAKVNKCNWVLKPHPAEKGLGKAKLKNLFPREKIPSNVKFWPEDASSTETFDYADLIITARGSSSLIYGSEKKKVLTAEKCHYTEFNVCKSVDNKEDYEKNLKEIDQLINSEFDFSDQDFAKMFFGISHSEDRSKLSFPYGFYGQNLYKTLSKFINLNFDKIMNEINEIKLWEKSGHDRYNTFKNFKELN